MAKKSIKNKSQTNGNLESKNLKYHTVAALLGETGVNKFGTLDPVEYEGQLRNMTTSELNKYSVENGIKPIHNREITIKGLLNQFRKHVNNFAVYEKPLYEDNLKNDKELKDMLKL